MQLLLMLMQYLLRTRLHKRKTASEQLIDKKELLPMRFALVRAGIRRRAVWSYGVSRSWKSPSFSLRQKRQMATAIVIPGETVMTAFRKNPSAAKHIASAACCRGQVRNHPVHSNRVATYNLLTRGVDSGAAGGKFQDWTFDTGD